MPWMTARSVVGTNAAGSAIAASYPVNSFTFDPERAESVPGSRFIGKPFPASDRPGARWAECDIGVDLCAASAATTHPWKALLNACAFSYASGPVFTYGDPHLATGDVYAGAAIAADIEVDVDGDGATASSSWQTIVKSWLGTVDIIIEAGQIPQMMFSGRGLLDSSTVTTPYLQGTIADIWPASTVTTLPTATRWYPGGVATTNSVFTAANIKSIALRMNNQLAMRRAVSAAIQGVLAPAITASAPELEVLVEVPALSTTTNPKPVFLGQTIGTFGVTHEFSTGNTFALGCSSFQVASLPTAEEVEGILCQRVLMKPTKASGITLTWTFT